MLFAHTLANPRLQRSLVRFTDGLLVNGARKTNVCFRSRLFFVCAYYIIIYPHCQFFLRGGKFFGNLLTFGGFGGKVLCVNDVY
jgi:hypothetical protein